MDHQPDFRSKRRTSSFCCSHDSGSIETEANASQPNQEVQSNEGPEAVAVHSTRFRRASFALSGERQGVLDELINSASLQATQAAAHREAETIINASVSPPPEEIGDGSTHCQRPSVATLMAGHPGLPLSCSDSTYSDSSSTTEFRHSHEDAPQATRGNFEGDHWKENNLAWFKTDSFMSNPLSSSVVKQFLAALATDIQPDDTTAAHQRVQTTTLHPSIGDNIPGLFRLSSPPVASMTMPVQQVRRAHAQQQQPSIMITSSPFDRPSTAYGHRQTRPFTDISDAETWGTSYATALGYVSDNHLLDAKQLRLAGQRLEADYHRSTASLPRSPKRTRPRSGTREAAGSPPIPTLTSPPSSAFSSRLNLTQIYDGLPNSRSRHQSSLRSSVASLNLDLPQACHTPPSTPNSYHNKTDGSSQGSINQQTATMNANGMQRLRSLFDNLKPQMPSDDTEKYIYMDEKARARRAEGQAANVMSPVSF